MSSKTISYYIRMFLSYYLTDVVNYDENTVLSYRDTIKLFMKFLSEKKSYIIANINFDVLKKDLILEFLEWIEKERKCSINTRNQRLACLKSLAKYIIQEEPFALDYCQDICNIQFKKKNTKEIEYLSVEELNELFSRPNKNTKKGRKDLLILTTLYDGALRVSELINLKVCNIKFGNPTRLLILNSKRKKSREIPITQNTSTLLKNFIDNEKLNNDDYVFLSNQKKKYTSNGIRKIISKYSNNFRFKVTPHTFRHTKASHLVEADIPLIYIKDFLGHSSTETTEMYAKVNNRIKNEVITNNSMQINSEIKYNIDDMNLIEWLESL